MPRQRSSCRFLATTNSDLASQVAAGRFREDVYFRLAVVTVRVPPLRERADDIPLLSDAFLARRAESRQEPVKHLSAEALALLQRYRWPGNVRELENALERAVILTTGDVIDVAALPERITEATPESLLSDRGSANPTLETIERAYIMWVLQAEHGNKTRAAEVLGIDPSTEVRDPLDRPLAISPGRVIEGVLA